jgi:hypothetical protein
VFAGVPQAQCVAQPRWQCLYRPRQVCAALTEEHKILRRRQSGHTQRLVLRRLQIASLSVKSPARCTLMIDRVVTHNSHKPRSHARVAVKLGDMPIGLEPRVLRDVLCILWRSDDPERCSIQRRVMAPNQFAKRQCVSVASLSDQFDVGEL